MGVGRSGERARGEDAPQAWDALRAPLGSIPPLLPVRPVDRPFDVTLRPPGSKSLTNRALLLAALAEGTSTLRHALVDADDGLAMIGAVRALGAEVDAGGDTLVVRGVGGRWKRAGTVNAAEAGTVARFVGAALLLAPGEVTLTGSGRMLERPMGDLESPLRALGARLDWPVRPGLLPVRVTPPATLPVAPTVTVAAAASSQFVSGLLLVAPFVPGGLTLRVEGEFVSAPYVEMTLGVLDRAGVATRFSEDLRVVRVSGGGVRGFDMEVEPDASGACPFWAAAAIVPGARVRVPVLGTASLQGDARFPELLARLGVRVWTEEGALCCEGPARLGAVLADMTEMPDAAMALAVTACFAQGTSILRGLGTLHHKECDRVLALAMELRKIGVATVTPVAGDADALTITPPPQGVDCSPGVERVEFETYGDHRIAMALALVGLRRPNVWIKGPGCVGKTYPGFWGDLGRVNSE